MIRRISVKTGVVLSTEPVLDAEDVTDGSR